MTCRHVMFDAPTGHRPDRITVELHTSRDDLSEVVELSMPLYNDGRAVWRQGGDGSGDIDVAVLEIDQTAVQDDIAYTAFTPNDIITDVTPVPIGSPLSVIGFPLGFHDTHHHLPVTRQAALASPFGLRFENQHLFLTDARTHRGLSGAPVIMMRSADDSRPSAMPWSLLGIHSARFNAGERIVELDEFLGLNCSWYADIIMTLTES